MTDIRRYYIPNSIIFITSVLKNRNPIFNDKNNLDLYFEVLEKVRKIHHFEFMAFVILPDHFHWLFKVDEKDSNFSKIIGSFKGNFTLFYKKLHQMTSPLVLWQRRFWDHVIRNEKDLAIHLDYIHWNPVKHRLVSDPFQWKNSSIDTWIKNGYYGNGWGVEEPKTIKELDFE